MKPYVHTVNRPEPSGMECGRSSGRLTSIQYQAFGVLGWKSRLEADMRVVLTVAAGLLVMVLGLAVGGLSASGGTLVPTDPDVPDTPCLADLEVQSFTATPSTVPLRKSTTLRWNVQIPRDCALLTLQLNGKPVLKQGSLTVTPIANTMYTLSVRWRGRLVGTIKSVVVEVRLPRRVTIYGDHLELLVRQALNTPGTTIRVLSGVELDFSLGAYANMPVAQGVTLIGTRTPRQRGPLLFTRSRPEKLLVIRGNDVRITGLRIQGADTDVSGGDRSTGIYVSPGKDVQLDHIEVDNNELSGWNGAAIGVNDRYDRIRYDRNPWSVRIHDNFIHHNQHPNKAGYGVVVGGGAYALIERNVFDYNRHAVAGDGSDDSGYRAHRNLVLKHGGRHKTLLLWGHTHQFDMHGQSRCIAPDYCGRAGHYVDIRRNSFLYTAGKAINIRGEPKLGAFVVSNVFAHEYPWDAVVQTPLHGNLEVSDNRLDIDGSDRYGACDFDGDGAGDRFMATGETWWYASRGDGPWTYLNTSETLLADLTLGQFDGDERCDVVSGGLISSGGTEPWRPR
jgi:Right handed beta helix region